MLHLIFSLLISQAPAATCSDWTMSRFLCVYNNQQVHVWDRQCDDYSITTQVCSDTDPNTWQGDCSPWSRHNGTLCAANGRLQPEWIRTCSNPYQATQICTQGNPNEME